ncbi:MAG: HAD family hydrolase [Erysipelotrichia bacterium]|nr:HAD family hydrolase [Erysipelotrichia bacterium]
MNERGNVMIENIEAVAADIDMTLTSKGGLLPEPTRKAFQILHEHGVMIGLATGREIEEKLHHAGEIWNLGFELDFIVGMNGGMVYNRHTGSMYAAELMTIAEMKEILNYLMPMIVKHRISINAEGGGNQNAMYIQGELLESAKRHGFVFVDKTGDADGFCDRRAYKFLFRSDPEYGQELRDAFLARFGENYQIIETFPGTVEIMHQGIDKGSGLKRYAEEADIDMKNIISFGDNENDNTLLQVSGWGVCLKDGSEGTKRFADALTDYDCKEGGVGHYLIDHYLQPNHMI